MVKVRRTRRLKLTKEDKDWAIAIKERDGWRCIICGSKERLNAHHLLPRELHDFKYDLDNGVTLCPKHHMFCRRISAHNNPIAFCKWLLEFRPDQINSAFEKCQIYY